ncbi:MAG: hypothetical protein KAH23_07205, partial [Kiritimatiellae bacterium]|nr:hypothetical protein [Kiritimatiellia bacterium]
IIFKQLLNLRKKKNFKSLAYTSNLQIKRNPDWLTPYFFLGIANIEMGQTNKAIENLRHVCDNTPFDPSYRQAHDLLKHITTNNTPPFSYPSR